MECSQASPPKSSKFSESHQDPSGVGCLRESLRDWIVESFQAEMNDGRAFGATLVLMDGLKRNVALEEYRLFERRVNRAIYGKSIQRHREKKPLKHVAFLEGGGNTGKEYHFHAIFVNPFDRSFTPEEFVVLVEVEWKRMAKSMKNGEVCFQMERLYDLRGWVDYMTKEYSKERGCGVGYIDSLDVKTLRL